MGLSLMISSNRGGGVVCHDGWIVVAGLGNVEENAMEWRTPRP